MVLGDHRICVVKVSIDNRVPLFVIGVYLPQRDCIISQFEEYLHHLEYIIANCQSNGSVIVAGDFNCHFGSEMGPRAWGKTTHNAHKLKCMIDRQSLSIMDLDVMCSGPSYTFHVDGVGTSYIDHCLVSNTLHGNIIACQVLHDHVLNTSDHMALRAVIDIDLPRCHNYVPTDMYKVAWNRLSIEQIHDGYTLQLERILYTVYVNYIKSIDMCPEAPIDDILQRIVECILSISREQLPSVNPSKYKKPFWSKSLTSMSKLQKSAWHQWVSQGRPRDNHNEYWLRYKEAKRSFRAAQRNAQKVYEANCIDELCKSQQVDHKYFWYLVKRHTKQRNNVQSTVDEDSGRVLYDPVEVRSSWYNYFQGLFQPVNKVNYDQEHRNTVERDIAHRLNNQGDIDDILVKFSVDEVRCMCQSLRKHKAAGWDSICAEHLIYGGDTLYKLLTLVFNHISRSHNVPQHIKKGIIAPIPKGKDRNMLSKDNYRGITLLSVVSKVYEKLLLQWFEKYNVIKINSLQGACVNGSSSLNTAMILRENIAALGNHGNPVYVCLLDARKAFDTVWHKGLFYKLANMGCNKHLWLILWSYYQGFLCSVQVAGGRTPWFVAEQGVHQGGPFSMKLYIVFNSDLLDQLQSCAHGALTPGSVHCLSCPSYADDIAMVTLYKPSMQAMVDIAFRHSCLWRYEFNSMKSHLLVFGRDLSPAMDVYLGGNALEIVKLDKHLGVPLAVDALRLAECIEARVSKGRRSFYASLALGSKYQPVPPLTLSKLYWSVTIPQMMYGLELVDLSDSAEQTLEAMHRSIARVIQGLPTQTAVPATLAPLRWWSLHAFLSYKRIILMIQILLMSCSSLSKELIIRSMCNNRRHLASGPITLMVNALSEYGLLGTMREAILSGSYGTICSWKSMARDRIWYLEWSRWHAHILLYKTMDIVKHCMREHVWPWWSHSFYRPADTRACRVMARLMSGEHCLASSVGRRRAKQVSYNTRLCALCVLYEIEDVAHMLFRCPFYLESLDLLWKELGRVGPNVLVRDMQSMPAHELTYFWFSGFRCKYCLEWVDMYSIICKYIHSVYDKRSMIMYV